ncbi:hypothetical protein [Streptomyces sp. NPDC005423]|uniref:hypothetical protein n=1 Tax=Streptomyces sp. NPDC005423 TaxID=3155343 RepID=UPI0033B3EF56
MSRYAHDELRARLREAAGTHEPDRARILARVERGMAAPRSGSGRRALRGPVWGWVRVVGATAGAAAILALGGYAVASAVRSDAPAERTVSVPAATGPSPDATSRAPARPAEPRPGTGGPRSSAPATGASSAPRVTGPASAAASPAATGAQDGPLWSDGAVDPGTNDFWGQSDVTLRNSTQLTALTVRLKIRETGGVSSTGAWRTLPEDDFTLTVAERDGFLVYTWTLRAGRTVPAGEWVFAAQYDHDRGGRNSTGDGYTAVAGTGDGRRRAVRGGFAATGTD